MSGELRVAQGRFRLSCVDMVTGGLDFMVLEADCDSKYPGEVLVSYWGDRRPPDVLVFHDPERPSLHLDETTDQVTVITLPERTAGWQVMAEGGRYTVRIVAWKHPAPAEARESRTELWRSAE